VNSNSRSNNYLSLSQFLSEKWKALLLSRYCHTLFFIKNIAVFVWLYRVYHLKCNLTTITYCCTKMKSDAGPPIVIDSLILPRGTWVKVTLVARMLLMQVAQKLCWCRYGLGLFMSRHVFILEHYFMSKSFAAVCEAFSSTYPDEEVLNKTTIHQLVTLCKVTWKTLKRVDACVWEDGGYFQHLL
jgi:hypothetical protein